MKILLTNWINIFGVFISVFVYPIMLNVNDLNVSLTVFQSMFASNLLVGVSKMVDAYDIGTAMGEYYGTKNLNTEDSCSYCGAKADHLDYDAHPLGKIYTKEKPTE